MRVRGRSLDSHGAPAAVRPYIGQTMVSVAKDYEVHALAVFEGLVVMLIVDDLQLPGWKPAWLFDVVDATIPGDWICSAFHEDPALVLGPKFIAGSREGYAAMVELEPKQVETFWRRVVSLAER